MLVCRSILGSSLRTLRTLGTLTTKDEDDNEDEDEDENDNDNH